MKIDPNKANSTIQVFNDKPGDIACIGWMATLLEGSVPVFNPGEPLIRDFIKPGHPGKLYYIDRGIIDTWWVFGFMERDNPIFASTDPFMAPMIKPWVSFDPGTGAILSIEKPFDPRKDAGGEYIGWWGKDGKSNVKDMFATFPQSDYIGFSVEAAAMWKALKNMMMQELPIIFAKGERGN
jgi:hypothetical protein